MPTLLPEEALAWAPLRNLVSPNFSHTSNFYSPRPEASVNNTGCPNSGMSSPTPTAGSSSCSSDSTLLGRLGCRALNLCSSASSYGCVCTARGFLSRSLRPLVDADVLKPGAPVKGVGTPRSGARVVRVRVPEATVDGSPCDRAFAIGGAGAGALDGGTNIRH